MYERYFEIREREGRIRDDFYERVRYSQRWFLVTMTKPIPEENHPWKRTTESERQWACHVMAGIKKKGEGSETYQRPDMKRKRGQHTPVKRAATLTLN